VPPPIDERMPLFTPDDIMAGKLPSGRVVLFDDDHYYMGGVIAELLAQKGCEVTLLTPAAFVSDWTRNTLEQAAIHRRLIGAGVKIVLNRGLAAIHADHVTTECSYTGQPEALACDAVVLVSSRVSDAALYHALQARQDEWADVGIKTVALIGDAAAPGPIAWATYAGHRYARELDEPDRGDELSFRREVTQLALA
jgi:dimethylamine/trimethylamine dehydrogenase